MSDFTRGVNILGGALGGIPGASVKLAAEYADHIRICGETNLTRLDGLYRACQKYGLGVVICYDGAGLDGVVKKFAGRMNVALEVSPDIAEEIAEASDLPVIAHYDDIAGRATELRVFKNRDIAVSFEFCEPKLFIGQSEKTQVFYPENIDVYNGMCRRENRPPVVAAGNEIGARWLDEVFRAMTTGIFRKLYCRSYGAALVAPQTSVKNYHLDMYKIFSRYRTSRAVSAEIFAAFVAGKLKCPEIMRLL